MATDVSKMSYSELKKLVEQANAALEDKRAEELKVLADGYVKKTEAAGFTIQEATEALKPYWPAKGIRATRTNSSGAIPKYRDPKTGDTYAGKGKVKRWLQAYLDAGKKKDDYLNPEWVKAHG